MKIPHDVTSYYLRNSIAVKNVHIVLTPEFIKGNGFSASWGLVAQSERSAWICD